MRKLLSEAAERAVRYLEGLDSRGVAPVAGAIEGLKKWDEPLPDGPTDPETVVALLDEIGSRATMAMAGPRFFGFVIGGALPAALAANWLAGAWDQNTALSAVTPGTALLERIALRWLLDVLGLPPTCGGAAPRWRTSRRLRPPATRFSPGWAGMWKPRGSSARPLSPSLWVLVSFGDAETATRVIAAIQADGTCWCGGTVWQGQVAMRISVSSWATTAADVERSLEAMLRVAAEQRRRTR